MTSRFLSSAVGRLIVVVVVVVERHAAVVALNEPAAGRVVVIGGQREAGVVGERIDGLHQALAEGGLADDEGTIVVLQRAANDLRSRSRAVVHEHDDGEVLAAVAMGRALRLFGIGASALRDDDLTLLQELVADRDRFGQQSAGIAAQIEHQTLEIGPKLSSASPTSRPVVSWNCVMWM